VHNFIKKITVFVAFIEQAGVGMQVTYT